MNHCTRHKPLAWDDMRFCPGCGAPYIQPPTTPRHCAQCGRTLYADPRLVACAVLSVEDGIVLVRRTHKDKGWMLPGGHVDQGEAVETALLREIEEETGLDATITGLVGVFSQPKDPLVVVAYTAVSQGTPYASGETRQAKIFHPHEIPWERLAFPATRTALIQALGLPRPTPLRMARNTSRIPKENSLL